MSVKPMLLKTPPGTLLTNVQIPDLTNGGFHPQLTDFYIPNSSNGAPISSIVCLHGGSGTKENFAKNLRVALNATVPMLASNVNWAMLQPYRTIAIFPQGSHCNGTVGPFNPNGANTENSAHPGGVATWSDWAMWSQADDVAFLKDLSSYITTTYGGIGKILGGHSNGGMMTQRMWREAPAYYGHYVACSGPASDHYISNPVTPASFKPFFVQYGLLDNVLDITDGPAGAGSHFYDPTLEQAPPQLSPADLAYPNPTFWIGPFAEYAAKVLAATGQTMHSGDGVVTTIPIGTQTTWTDATGNFVLQLLSNANHSVGTHEQCTKRYVLVDWLNFVVAT